jgi:RNA polymerase sigma-70 factor (ECF subfamily)
VVVAPRGKLLLVMTRTFVGDRITEINAVAEETRLSKMELTVPELVL